jgi:aminocarboxymuconate-semialdehyde decarboxylase
MERSGLPVWLHPARGPDYPDYEGETGSKYDINMVFGWAYDTTLAMTRLALSGYLEQLPKLKIIVHHAGAFIPVLANRVESIYGGGRSGYQPERRFSYRVAATGETAHLSRPPIEYLRMFYTDTVSHGSLAAVSAAYGFFGARNLLFGTDAPFDFAEGRIFTRSHRAVVDSMVITPSDRALIYGGNLQRLIGEIA